MSDLIEGLFDLMGEAASTVAEIAAEGAGALLEGTSAVAGSVTEGVGHLAGGAAEVVASVAGEGLVEAAVDAVVASGSTVAPGNSTAAATRAPETEARAALTPVARLREAARQRQDRTRRHRGSGQSGPREASDQAG